MKIFSFALMIVAGVLAVYGLTQERKGAEWGRPLATVAAAVALVLALFNLIAGTGGPDVEEIRKTQQAFQKIAGEKMGRFLAANHKGEKILVLGGVDYSEIMPEETLEKGGYDTTWKTYMEGLKKGMDDDVVLADVVRLAVPEEVKKAVAAMNDARTGDAPPDYFMMEEGMSLDAEDYNAALAPYLDDVDVIVSLTGLPYDVENMSIWAHEDPPKLALVGGGSLHKLKDAIAQSYIVSVITYRPQYDFEDRSIPKDLDEAFAKRFIMITPDNLAEMAQEHSRLFPGE